MNNTDMNNYLIEMCEKELDRSLPVRGQISSRDGKRPSVFLRYRETDPNKGYIRVYSGAHRYSYILSSLD